MDETKTISYDGEMVGGEEQSMGISADLIRGHINTIILRSLYDEDKYGYDIISDIEKKSGGQYSLKQPTLYSALKRLESLKYVESYFGDYSNGGRRKYFRLTDVGREVTEKNLAAWEYSRTIIDSLISDGKSHFDFSFISDKQSELAELKRSLAARETALEEEKRALNALKNELTRERSLLSVKSTTLDAEKSDVNELKSQIGEQKAQLAEKERILSEKQGEIDAKQQRILQTESEIRLSKLDLAQKAEEIVSLKAQLSRQQSELADKQAYINAQREELTQTQTSLDAAVNRCKILQEQIDGLQNSLEETAADTSVINALNAELIQARAELKSQTAIVDDLRAALARQEDAFALIKKEYEEKTSAHYNRSLELKSQEARIEDEKQLLEQQRAEFKRVVDETQTLRELLEQKERELTEKESEICEIQAKVVSSEKDFSFNTAALETREKELAAAQAKLAADKIDYERQKEDFERQRAEIESKYDELTELQSEISKREFDLTQRELEMSEKTKLLQTRQTQEGTQLQAEMEQLRRQQQELTERQELYNRQQLEFITDKNALAAQQFEFTDKLNDYNTQFTALQVERARLDEKETSLNELSETLTRREDELFASEAAINERKRQLDKEREVWDVEQTDSRAKLEESERELAERQQNLERYHAQLSQRAQELQRREDELALAEKQQAAQINSHLAPAAPYASSEYREPSAQTERAVNFDDLLKRAHEDGIRLKTAGSMRYSAPKQQYAEETPANGLFNKGLALFKSACFIFAIIAAECLAMFFLRETLGLHIAYPVVALVAGLVMLGVIGTMYAFGYQANARRAKNPTYGTTAAILFVISLLVVAMVSVYFKADLAEIKTLLTFIVIPVVYLLNIPFFAAFYFLFSRVQKHK